jgi:hypothetical protein
MRGIKMVPKMSKGEVTPEMTLKANYLLVKLSDFSLLIKSKILDSCFPAYRQAGAGMTAIAP